MSNIKLSEGALVTIMSGGQYDEPVMQVLGSKKIMGNAEKERYRLLVSDGKYQISFAMIATQINEKISSGELAVNTVIKIKKYITSMINNAGKGDRRVMVILDMDIIKPGSEVGGRLGNPTALPDDLNTLLNKPSTSEAPKPTTNGTTSNTSTFYQPKPMDTSTSNQTTSLTSHATVPISSLSPYQNRWVIKARVTNKSSIRTWSNNKGEGKLFSLDLCDESGEIRATAFRDLVDKFYNMIEIDKVYYISKCQLKVAKKEFSTLKNDYEMTFNNDTIVELCCDAVALPPVIYNFVPIDKITEIDTNSVIDVIGVCKAANDLQCITARTTKRELKKRDITLVDQTHCAITLTLWGNEAETFDASSQPILAIRGAKISEFGGGKNLAVFASSVMKINPDIPEAHRLKGWFDNSGRHEDVVNLSARTGTNNFQTQWMSFKEVKDSRLGSAERGDYYQNKATILLVNQSHPLYKACPTEGCNKKVVDMENGMFRCEKCNREYPNFKFRLLMSMNIADWHNNQWVSVFTSEAEKILGVTSQELGEAQVHDSDAINDACQKANFSEYIFKCRAKMETYNDEARMKTVVVRVDPINFRDYNSHLVSKIREILV